MEYMYKNSEQFKHEDEFTHPIFDIAFQSHTDKREWFIKYSNWRSIDKYWKYTGLTLDLRLP